MSARTGTTRPGLRAALLAAVLLMPAQQTVAQTVPIAAAVVSDLVAALALQGVRCEEVASVERVGEDDYTVDCADQGRFRLLVGEGGDLQLLTIAAKIARTGVDALGAVVRLPGRLLGFSETSPEHVADVSDRLLALITLSGRDCDEITGVERRAVDDHVVSCGGGESYRVHAAPDGLVAIDSR